MYTNQELLVFLFSQEKVFKGTAHVSGHAINRKFPIGKLGWKIVSLMLELTTEKKEDGNLLFM